VDATVLFLDTQIFLHYQPIEQVDWPALTGSKELTIILAPIVLRELDKHKQTHPIGRLKKRAANTLARLDQWAEQGLRTSLRAGVTLGFLPYEPQIDFVAHRLSRDWHDDQLLASLIEFCQEHPEECVALVTADAGLKLKARSRGIRLLVLADDQKLPEEPDPNEQRVKQLEQELREQKLRSPKLRVCFEGGLDHRDVCLPAPVDPCEEGLARELALVRSRLPRFPLDQYSSFTTIRPAMEIAYGIGVGASDADIAAYNEQLGAYYEHYIEWLCRNCHSENEYRGTFELPLCLTNEGSGAATDLHIFLEFPESVRLYGKENPRSQPPAPPAPPMGGLERRFGPDVAATLMGRPASQKVPDAGPPQPNVRGPILRHEPVPSAEYRVGKLKHKLIETLAGLFVTFPSPADAASFAVTYRINAENVPEEVTGKLHVVIEKQGS
jgi:hypothetical protein